MPEDITANGYKAVNLLLTDDEQAHWQAAYQKNADGTYTLKAAADIEALDAEFTQPIAIYYMVSQADTSAFTKGARSTPPRLTSAASICRSQKEQSGLEDLTG